MIKGESRRDDETILSQQINFRIKQTIEKKNLLKQIASHLFSIPILVLDLPKYIIKNALSLV